MRNTFSHAKGLYASKQCKYDEKLGLAVYFINININLIMLDLQWIFTKLAEKYTIIRLFYKKY